MSIINDAIKKARNESGLDNNVLGSRGCPLPQVSDKKWTVLVTISLVLIASLFGSLVLYKNMIRADRPSYGTNTDTSDPVIHTTLNDIEEKSPSRPMKQENTARLNGIVYGQDSKWAIVNNRIVKEGDELFGGEIIAITRESVKVEKKDGTILVLNLK